MPDIEDIYPLTGPQQGMLFHSVSAETPGVYVEQVVWELSGELDPHCLAQAWQLVIDRNPALRTSFLWQEVEEPVQVVHRDIQAALSIRDWRALAEDVKATRLDALLSEERTIGFDLTRPPLVRLVLVQVGAARSWLAWTCHHSILDGWSVAELRRELMVTHQRLRFAKPTALRARRPFRDFIQWLGEREPGSDLDYWKQQMGGFAAPLRLPGGFNPGATGDLGTIEVTFTDTECAAITAGASRAQVSVNTLVQGAWAVLLERYCGQADVVFGVISAGRPLDLAEVDRMVGPFVATTPLRVAVEDQPVLDWLRDLQVGQLETRAHEHTPLPDIHAVTPVPRATQLFETVVAFENHLADATLAERTAGLSVRALRSSGHTNYAVTVIATAGETLRLRLSYQAARFDEDWMRRLGGHMRTLILALADASSADRVDSVPMLGEDEIATFARWNATDTPAADIRLDTMVLRRCAEQPDAEAVVCADRRLSYGEVSRAAHALARRLLAAGASADHPVAVIMDRGWQHVVAVLGILRAGAAYLPIDASWPAERVRELVELGTCALAVTADGPAGPPSLPPGVRVLAVADSPPDEDVDPVPENGSPEDLAYVIYTSGSTGVPKGVAVEHRSAANTILDINHRFAVGRGDRVFALSPLSFDLSVWDIFGTLAAGGTIVLAPPAARPDPADWVEWADTERITVWNSVPALFDLVVDRAAVNPERLATLRLALLSGDWIPVSLPDRARAMVADLQVISLGGATEGSIWSIHHPVGEIDSGWDSIPYGTPLANQRFHVLDHRLRRVPAGVPGELAIGGAGVVRGYWCDEERTAKSFTSHPETGERLYLTGDVGMHGKGGVLRFLGRLDDQVKINGFRVEPGELEATLARHPAVAEAAVVVDGDRHRRRLLACLVPATDAPDKAELREFLASCLPAYLIPARIVALPEFPLTTNGKVDRRELAVLAVARQDQVNEYVPAQTKTERLLVSIWRDVLGVDRVGVLDNFFELAGDSLRSMRVAALLHRNNVTVSVGTLFDRPTIRDLAAWIETQGPGHTELVDLPPIAHGDDVAVPVGLTYAQQMVQILTMLTPGNTQYVPRLALEFRGELDLADLRHATEDLVVRHAALRAVFTVDESGALRQSVRPDKRDGPHGDPRIEIVDLTHLSEDEAQQETGRVLAEDIVRTFDATAGEPLYRLALLRIRPDRHILLMAVDHLVCDGWSLGILSRDLLELYRAHRSGVTPTLPTLAVTYSDYARWQHEHFTGERLKRTISFWRNRMAGAPPMQLPSDRPPVTLDQMLGEVLPVRVPEDIVAGLETLARLQRTTLFAVLMAAVQTLLWTRVGEDVVTVSTPAGGRIRPEVQEVVGCFVNGMMFPTDMTGDPTFEAVVARVRDGLRAGWEHQNLPLSAMAEIQEFATVNGMGTQGVSLEWVDEDITPVHLPGGEQPLVARPWWPRRSGRVDMPPADLFVYLHRGEGGGLDGEFMFNARRFELDDIEGIFAQFTEILRAAATDSGLPLSRLREKGSMPARLNN